MGCESSPKFGDTAYQPQNCEAKQISSHNQPKPPQCFLSNFIPVCCWWQECSLKLQTFKFNCMLMPSDYFKTNLLSKSQQQNGPQFSPENLPDATLDPPWPPGSPTEAIPQSSPPKDHGKFLKVLRSHGKSWKNGWGWMNKTWTKKSCFLLIFFVRKKKTKPPNNMSLCKINPPKKTCLLFFLNCL